MILETAAIRTIWAKAWDALKAVPWFIWVGAAIVALWFIDRNAQYREGDAAGYGRAQAEHRDAELAAIRAQEESAAVADSERTTDTATIGTDQEARNNAINSTTDTRPSDASNALNCERLRRAGADIQHIPACNGR